MYDEYLEQFMPSIEIREYLKGKELRTWAITEMIYYSPVAIEKKKAAFYSLYETAKSNDNPELAKQCKVYIDNIEAFLELLAQEGVFSVSLCYYDEKIKEIDYDFHCVCASIEDVLEIDRFPFGPKIKILIIQVGDNLDCCCLQALSKTEEGLWHLGAVKHGMIGYHIFPQLSPLYFAKKWEGDLQDSDGKIILEVQKYLNGDDEKGEKLLEKFMHDMTDEELLEGIQS